MDDESGKSALGAVGVALAVGNRVALSVRGLHARSAPWALLLDARKFALPDGAGDALRRFRRNTNDFGYNYAPLPRYRRSASSRSPSPSWSSPPSARCGATLPRPKRRHGRPRRHPQPPRPGSTPHPLLLSRPLRPHRRLADSHGGAHRRRLRVRRARGFAFRLLPRGSLSRRLGRTGGFRLHWGGSLGNGCYASVEGKVRGRRLIEQRRVARRGDLVRPHQRGSQGLDKTLDRKVVRITLSVSSCEKTLRGESVPVACSTTKQARTRREKRVQKNVPVFVDSFDSFPDEASAAPRFVRVVSSWGFVTRRLVTNKKGGTATLARFCRFWPRSTCRALRARVRRRGPRHSNKRESMRGAMCAVVNVANPPCGMSRGTSARVVSTRAPDAVARARAGCPAPRPFPA